MARFQILSLIGGGIRGAFITSFLYELEKKLGRPIAECFDLIAGTSTGGIIAAGLAMGRPAAEVHDFYVRYGEQIFSPRPPYKARGIMRPIFPVANWVFQRRTGGGLDAAFRARFCPDALQKAFDEGFGERTLGSARCSRLIIPTVNLTQGIPHVFRTPHIPKGVHDQDVKMSDVLIAATAAPTYFPHRVIKGNAYVDGGVWATDPSLLAFAEAMRIQQVETKCSDLSMCSFNETRLLSIGTGRANFSLSPPGADAGLLYWATRVADVMGTSQIQGVHLPMKFLLGERYQHVNFEMKESWPLDAIEYIPDLFEVGRQRSEECYEELSEKFLCHERVPYTPFDSPQNEIELHEFGH